MCLSSCVVLIDQNNRLQDRDRTQDVEHKMILWMTLNAGQCSCVFLLIENMNILAHSLKIQSWKGNHEKQYFFKSQAENILCVVNKKKPVSMGDICWEEVSSMLLWLKQTVSQSKPNCPMYAKYVPHHPADQCNYMKADVQIWRLRRLEFSPSVTEPSPTGSSLLLLILDRPMSWTNLEQALLSSVL